MHFACHILLRLDTFCYIELRKYDTFGATYKLLFDIILLGSQLVCGSWAYISFLVISWDLNVGLITLISGQLFKVNVLKAILLFDGTEAAGMQSI